VSGVVLRVHQESETSLAAGMPLVEIGNPDLLEVVVDLLSTDAVKVKPGFPALITGWGGDATLHARVRLVEPSGFTKISALGVEEQRVNVLLDFLEMEHSARTLGDGYRVEVNVIVSERRGVLKVPTSALFRVGDRWRVFAARDGRASTVEIQLGQRNAMEAEVVSGLAEHDAVIVHPGDTIADGVAVIQREQP
jgi:HlyD family secretion protein